MCIRDRSRRSSMLFSVLIMSSSSSLFPVVFNRRFRLLARILFSSFSICCRGCLLYTSIAVFYLFSTQFINRLYASYLREKAYLTAPKHWEKDEVDEQSYQIIKRKYDELLPEAHEILLNLDRISIRKR